MAGNFVIHSAFTSARKHVFTPSGRSHSFLTAAGPDNCVERYSVPVVVAIDLEM